MVADLISVGTEILMGKIVNTNAAYLSRKLAQIGVSVYYQSTVGDNKERLAQAMKQAIFRADEKAGSRLYRRFVPCYFHRSENYQGKSPLNSRYHYRNL